jgi:hypothetical protein
MATRNNDNVRGNERNLTGNRGEQHSSVPNDLPDSPQDREKLKPEETFIDLPDVSDIPGQEHVSAPRLGELADTTISSAGEEGDEIFDDDDLDGDVEYIMGTEGDVSRDERRSLEDETYMPTRDFRISIAGTERALTAIAGGELTAAPFKGAPEQLWRIDQLTDGTYRIGPKAVPGTADALVLSAVGSSMPTLAKFDPASDRQRWLLGAP